MPRRHLLTIYVAVAAVTIAVTLLSIAGWLLDQTTPKEEDPK